MLKILESWQNEVLFILISIKDNCFLQQGLKKITSFLLKSWYFTQKTGQNSKP